MPPKPKTGFRCSVCMKNTRKMKEYYMLVFHTWHEATRIARPRLPTRSMLCIGCVEERLGRKLCPKDFKYAPVNWYYFEQSARLRDRLGAADEQEAVLNFTACLLGVRPEHFAVMLKEFLEGIPKLSETTKLILANSIANVEARHRRVVLSEVQA